jgi:hypothetical protein
VHILDRLYNDSIFYYTKSDKFTFNAQYASHSEKYVSDFYKYVEQETGNGCAYEMPLDIYIVENIMETHSAELGS